MCFNSRGHQFVKAVSRCIPRKCVSYIKLHSKFCCTATQAHHDTSRHIRLHWPSDPMISIAFFVLLYFEHWLLFFYLSMVYTVYLKQLHI